MKRLKAVSMKFSVIRLFAKVTKIRKYLNNIIKLLHNYINNFHPVREHQAPIFEYFYSSTLPLIFAVPKWVRIKPLNAHLPPGKWTDSLYTGRYMVPVRARWLQIIVFLPVFNAYTVNYIFTNLLTHSRFLRTTRFNI